MKGLEGLKLVPAVATLAICFGALASVALPVAAQDASAPLLPTAPPAAFTPAPGEGGPPAPEGDTWIFSGVLIETHEAFSGTLITGGTHAFELKLAGGATCDGGDLQPSLGLVRLSEITCTDERRMRALFVPEGHEALKVFGHVGDARFATIAHLLGTKAPPEPKQTAEPHAPTPPVTEPPASPVAPQRRGSPSDDPG